MPITEYRLTHDNFPARDDLAVEREALSRLRAVVVLSGTVGTSGITGAAQRAPLMLPVGGNTRLLECWLEQVQQLQQRGGADGLAVRFLANMPLTNGAVLPKDNGLQVRFEQDRGALRGTAGLLRDVAADYPDDGYLAVVNAAQLMVQPLHAALVALASATADVAMFCGRENEPGGIMLLRCGCLRQIAEMGFVDLKEQALPAISREHRTVIVRTDELIALPIRTAAQYVEALRWHHQQGVANPARIDSAEAFSEQWSPTFSLWEAGAEVDPSARLYDSVVLDGGKVNRAAVLVRSVVCSGGVVEANKKMIDQVITSAGQLNQPKGQ